jgi:hypothetical protein
MGRYIKWVVRLIRPKSVKNISWIGIEWFWVIRRGSSKKIIHEIHLKIEKNDLTIDDD